MMSGDGPMTVERFVGDLEFLGPCRFVVVGEGAVRALTSLFITPAPFIYISQSHDFITSCRAQILEAVGAFEDLRLNDKGLATVSTDTGFECHIKLAEVQKAAFATKDSPKGKKLHIVRLLGAQDKPLLSAILSPETPGEEVEEGAIEYYGKLKERFGEKFDLAQ